VKHRWIGKVEPEAIPADELAALARLVIPGIDPKQLRPLTGGFRNWNYRVDTPHGSRVLRVYARGDRSAWKEQRLADLLGPEVMTPKYVEIAEVADRVVAVREFVEGTVLHELVSTDGAIGADVAHVMGRTLAAIHRIEFDEFGELDSDLNITEHYDLSGAGIRHYVQRMLEAGLTAERLGPALTDELLRTLEQSGDLLDAWRQRPVLAHSDFGSGKPPIVARPQEATPLLG